MGERQGRQNPDVLKGGRGNCKYEGGEPLPEEIAWTYNPWTSKPVNSALAGILLLAVVLIVLLNFAEKGWAVLAFVFLFGMNLTLFVPVSYKLDDSGVSVYFLGTKSFRAWKHYRNAYIHNDGIFLTTEPKPSPLDPFRGHFLKFNQNKELVQAYVKSHMKLGLEKEHG